MNKNITYWSVIVPKALDALLEQAVKEGTFRTKSDLIRAAVRHELEKMGFQWKCAF